MGIDIQRPNGKDAILKLLSMRYEDFLKYMNIVILYPYFIHCYP